MILPHERSENPMGSLEELEAIGADKNMWGSCSERKAGAGGSLGCPFWGTCEFKDMKNASGGPPPVSIAVYKYNNHEKTSNTTQVSCYMYYAAGMNIEKNESYKTKNVVKVVAIEGDGRKFKTRVTRPLHKIPDRQNCPDCARGDCRRRVMEYMEKEVVPFERPTQTLSILSESRRVQELPEISMSNPRPSVSEDILEMGSKKK